jgi:hypothetical protein
MERTRPRNPQLAEFLRAKRASDLFSKYSNWLPFRLIPQHQRLLFGAQLSMTSWDKKMEVYRSSILVTVAFYAPDLPERRARLSKPQLEVINNRHFVQVDSSDEDNVSLRCLPEDLPDLQKTILLHHELRALGPFEQVGRHQRRGCRLSAS